MPAPLSDRPLDECPCYCHGHFEAPCDIEGGCGHLHVEAVHRCARDKRCAQRVKEDHDEGFTWVGTPIAIPRGVCEVCEQHIASAIMYLPDDYRELGGLLGATGGGGSSDVIRFSRELPIPIRLAIQTLREQIVEATCTWVAPVAEAMNMEWLSTTEQSMSRAAYRVFKACGILENTVHTLLALGPQEVSAWDDQGMPVWDPEYDCQDVVELDGVDGALRLLRLHELAKVAAGHGELQHRLHAPCPRCDRLTLVRDNGCSDVYCKSCGERWDEDHYKELTMVLVNAETLRIRECKHCDRKGRLPDRTPCSHPAESAAA